MGMQLDGARRSCGETPFERGGGQQRMLQRFEDVGIERADFLPRVFRRDLTSTRPPINALPSTASDASMGRE
jgi:hypothetical protein